MTNPPTSPQGVTAGGALFGKLKALGVDYVFANSGTDFPPIIEGLAEAAAEGLPLPRAVTVPHETACVAMAHGYALATGRAQAAMVHTNVGLANAAMGAINARADNVPMLLFSGRTPTLEQGRFGARTVPIGWGQEMSDQHALIREACKWDYELRFPEQVGELLDRAHGIAHHHHFHIALVDAVFGKQGSEKNSRRALGGNFLADHVLGLTNGIFLQGEVGERMLLVASRDSANGNSGRAGQHQRRTG